MRIMIITTTSLSTVGILLWARRVLENILVALHQKRGDEIFLINDLDSKVSARSEKH